MANSIQSITLDKLIAHPDNPNEMSRVNFAKLVRNIERSSRYEPLIVRPYRDRIIRREEKIKKINRDNSANSAVKNSDCFQIINGHHRCQALKLLNYKSADCVVWDIDDEQTDILLATLNRLGGSDVLDKKLALLKRLNRKKMQGGVLAKLLPQTAKQIERLTNPERPSTPAKMDANCLANPVVFFVDDTQQQTIESALSLAERYKMDSCLCRNDRGKTKAAKRAAALAQIAGHFLKHSKLNSRT